MRLVIARCSATYEGRLSSALTSAVRLLMVKADGCVAVHADVGAYKPLNWISGLLWNTPSNLVVDDRTNDGGHHEGRGLRTPEPA